MGIKNGKMFKYILMSVPCVAVPHNMNYQSIISLIGQ